LQHRCIAGREAHPRPARAALLAVAVQLGRERALEGRAPGRDAIQAGARSERRLARIGQQEVEGSKQ
ncbi:MAG TPA: hypothetical protein VGB31_07380, partial [Myxococcota bacterium]